MVHVGGGHNIYTYTYIKQEMAKSKTYRLSCFDIDSVAELLFILGEGEGEREKRESGRDRNRKLKTIEITYLKLQSYGIIYIYMCVDK